MNHFFSLPVAVAFLTIFAGCTPKLIYNSALPEIKPISDKALCIILRLAPGYGSSKFIPVYCDQKYVGGTERETMLTIPVDSGQHYIIADAINKSKVRYNFRPGKIYFIKHSVMTIYGPYVSITTSTFSPMDDKEAMKIIEEEKANLRWVQINTENKDSEDLKTDDFNEVKKDYEEWFADPKNAEDVSKEANYPGY
jgi:hypothetical protein